MVTPLFQAIRVLLLMLLYKSQGSQRLWWDDLAHQVVTRCAWTYYKVTNLTVVISQSRHSSLNLMILFLMWLCNVIKVFSSHRIIPHTISSKDSLFNMGSITVRIKDLLFHMGSIATSTKEFICFTYHSCFTIFREYGKVFTTPVYWHAAYADVHR